MDMTFEEMVRERAYHIWMAAGMQDGLAHEHWTCAEQAVASEVTKPAKAPAKTMTAKTMTAKTMAAKAASPKKPAAAKKAPAKTTEKKATAKSSKAKH